LCSFQIDRPGGFLDTEVELLRRLTPVLALTFKSVIAVETAGTLMATYLGEDASRRVMAGRHRPGRRGNSTGGALVQRPRGLHAHCRRNVGP
jgi:hypothetical protein